MKQPARLALNALWGELDQAAAETEPGGMRMRDGRGEAWLLTREHLADYVRRCVRVALERARP